MIWKNSEKQLTQFSCKEQKQLHEAREILYLIKNMDVKCSYCYTKELIERLINDFEIAWGEL